MKKLIILAAFLPFLIVSCGGSSDDGATDGMNEDSLALSFDDMNEISLVEEGLNLRLMLPEVASSTGNSIDPRIDHEEGDYLWYLTIGPRFELIIEDYGKEKDKTLNEKKRLSELEKIFDYEYIVDEPKLIMYQRTLHEGQGGKKSYHCYGEVMIDGYNYVLRSGEEGELRPIIEDMVKTIRSAKPIQGA